LTGRLALGAGILVRRQRRWLHTNLLYTSISFARSTI